MFEFKEEHYYSYIHLTDADGNIVITVRRDKINAIVLEPLGEQTVRRMYVEGVPPIALSESQARQLYAKIGGVKESE